MTTADRLECLIASTFADLREEEYLLARALSDRKRGLDVSPDYLSDVRANIEDFNFLIGTLR